MSSQTELFSNNAQTTLAGSITNVATTANLAAGAGVLFPAPGAGQFFCMTFVDAATGQLNEIVHVTNVTGDVVTMVRGQEGTTALAWLAGDIAANFMTAGSAAGMVQEPELQSQPGNYGTDTGSANALAITLSVAPLSLAAITGSALRVKKSGSPNSGAATLNVNALGAATIIHADGTALSGGELPANGIFTVVYDGTHFVLQSVGTAGSVSLGQLQLQAGNFADDTGTANALVATLSPVPASLASLVGAPIRITKNVNPNSGGVTLTLNGFTATAIVYGDGTAMNPGDLPGGCTFSLIYDGSHFVLQSLMLSSTTQAGQIAVWPTNAPPTGWLECNGAAISRTTYARLNAVASAFSYAAPFGVGDGSTTFNLPDLRGYFVRGWDDGRGVDPARTFGSQQADAFASHTHTFGVYASDASGPNAADGSGGKSYDVPTAATGGTETRPKNIALLYIIKT